MVAKPMNALYPWLVESYAKIANSFQEGVAHHALLIKADKGLGAEQLCAALNARIICQTPENNAACGHCHSCHLMAGQSHPDFHQLASIEGKDIGIEQVRAITEIVSQRAQQNGNKLVYIAQAERLTQAAANALLKTLEEPPENTYFLLQTNNTSELPATIYSRCQIWSITPPSKEAAKQWLKQQTSADDAEIAIALAMSLNLPLLALEAMQQGLIEKRKNFLRQFWLFYRRRSPLEILPAFEKEQTLQQLDWILAFLNDALKEKLEINQGRQNPDLLLGIHQFAAELHTLQLLQAVQIVQQCRQDLLTINGVNHELMLLDALSKLITEVFEKEMAA